MLTAEDVQHIAALARIRISKEEVDRIRGEFDSILAFVGHLNELTTTDVVSDVNAAQAIQGRNDVASLSLSFEDKDLLLNQAPAREGEYVKVKAVFE